MIKVDYLLIFCSAHYSRFNWNSAACCRCTFYRCHNWRPLMLLLLTPPLTAPPQKAPLPGSLYPQHRVSSDEDPYSLSPAESSGSSGKGLRQTRWGHHVSSAEHGVKYISLRSGLKRRNVSGSRHSSSVKIHWSDAASGGTRVGTGWAGRGTTTGRSTGRHQPSSPTCPRRWAAAADTARPGRGGGRGGGGARGRDRGTAATSPRTRTTTAWAPGCPPSPPPRWTRRATATARPPGDLSTLEL